MSRRAADTSYVGTRRQESTRKRISVIRQPQLIPRNCVNFPSGPISCFGCNPGRARGNSSDIAPAHTAGVQQLRKLSPYMMVELLLPGGTLIALLLWLYRRKFPHQSL